MVKFNHEVQTFYESLGINETRALTLSGTILFEMINQAYLVKKLYDKPEQAPRNMITKTGVLEKVMTYTKNQTEELYCVYEFAKIDTLNNSNGEGEKAMMAIHLLFMMSDMDYDKFITTFLQRKKDFDAEND
jgi:hypothetical protein